jgi:hypothetical protein
VEPTHEEKCDFRSLRAHHDRRQVDQATLADSDAARDFASLLPLTLALNDLFRREKFVAACHFRTREAHA